MGADKPSESGHAETRQILAELGDLATEQRNPLTADIDLVDVETCLQLINDQDRSVPDVVRSQIPAIARAVEHVQRSLRSGGRLVYLGAGTSGRLGVLDASECPPTYGTDPDRIVGVIAGGPAALVRSQEGVEDREDVAVTDLKRVPLQAGDTLVALTASRRTPYAVAGIRYASSIGASTVFITCNAAPDGLPADVVISLRTGPEVIAGSTRMKAGTAQKLVLNMITTATMVQLGKTYGNLMVDLRPMSRKLTVRSLRMLMTLLDVEQKEAQELLDAAAGSLKVALFMGLEGCDAGVARRRLDAAGGVLRKALGESPA
jgi:N-acetylmuramic acid 6-phosphate etherase